MRITYVTTDSEQSLSTFQLVCHGTVQLIHRSGISEGSFEHHKAGSFSQIARLPPGISAREQPGVTTDLAQDPTFVRRYAALSLISTHFSTLDTHQHCSSVPKLLIRGIRSSTFSYGLTPFSCRCLARQCSSKINRRE